ncbi:MAG TPA: DUF167 domain-containing protein [Vicinamibacterales bacterium]|nr:DUF167 domain-containing protein [Vicinamibacterales bacterium]
MTMITTRAGGVAIAIRVIPRAARAGLAGTRGDALAVRLTAPPVEGAANEELVGLLAEVLRVPRRAITILHGERSRSKILRVDGIDAETCRTLLASQPTS